MIEELLLAKETYMRTFAIEGGKDSPKVYMNEAEGFVEISGNSTLPNAQWYYSNLLKWMIAFNKGGSRTATIDIKLARINESSSHWLTLIFKKLMFFVPIANLEINWYMSSQSTRIIACGQVLKNETSYQVNLVLN